MENILYTLKLDASWQPIEIISADKGFSMVFAKRAQVIENYIQKPCALFYYPSIIKLNSYIRKTPIKLSVSRRNVYWRDGYKCQYCGKKFLSDNLTLDHIIPKSRGGENTWSNLVTCCKSCNQKKGSMTPSEASMRVLCSPSRPAFNVLGGANINIPIQESWKQFLN